MLQRNGVPVARVTLKNASAQHPARRAALVRSLMGQITATLRLPGSAKGTFFAERFLLITCSNGGRVACEVFAAKPQAVAGLILTGYPCVSGTNPSAPHRTEYKQLVSTEPDADYSNIVCVALRAVGRSA